MKKTKTNEDLAKVWKKYLSSNKTDEKSKDFLVEYYYKTLVQKIAKKMTKKFHYKIQSDELASHGVFGLYTALERFDESRGVKFETYAYTRIRGSVIDALREEDRVPRSVRMRQTKIEKTRDQLESEKGCKISNEEAVLRAGIDLNEYNKNRNKFHPNYYMSIENTINDIESDNNKKDFNECLVDSHESSVDGKMIRQEFLYKLMSKNFSPLERKIIYHYYYEGSPLCEIAKHLGLSESRISQKHQLILKKMRKKIEVNPNYFNVDIVNFIKNCNNKNSLT